MQSELPTPKNPLSGAAVIGILTGLLAISGVEYAIRHFGSQTHRITYTDVSPIRQLELMDSRQRSFPGESCYRTVQSNGHFNLTFVGRNYKPSALETNQWGEKIN